jgi:hypothetical protein
VAPRAERGQSTVEWVGLLLVLALAIGALGALAGVALPGTALARAIGGRIVCALELSGECQRLGPSDLVLAYGDELAALVIETAPQIRYEPGMRALPVDFRHCRTDDCAEGRDGIRVASSLTGEPAAVFTHAIDCRPGSQTPGADCSGEAAGNRYLQYWLYYPGSATGEGSTFLRGAIRELSADVGHPTYHPDDWESVQFRVHPDGSAEVRASAHYGYGAGWQRAEDSAYTVSGGSHAGTVEPAEFDRITNPRRLGLIPLEPIAAENADLEFAITPPWRKRVWLEPEYDGTD